MGVTISGLARGGIEDALTTDEITALLEEMPQWLSQERFNLAEVRDDRLPGLPVQRDPEELAPPLGYRERGAGQAIDEVFARAVVTTQRALVEDGDGCDDSAGHGRLESRAHHLDFGQLRH